MWNFERDLGTLLRHRGHSSLSVYLPLEGRPDHRQENEIRWKNLRRRAREMLSRTEAPSRTVLAAVSDAVAPLLQAPGNRSGCAVMHGGSHTRVYGLPAKVSPLVVVGDRFHLKPLLAARDGLCSFLLLVVGRSHAHLYRGTESELLELPLPAGTPRGIREVVPDGSRQKHLQSHSGASGGRSPMIHGQGLGERRHDADLHRYLHTLDASLGPVLDAHGGPIVVSGEAKLLSAFDAVTTHRERIALAVPGTFEGAGVDELIGRIVPELLEARRKQRQAETANLGALARSGKLSLRLTELVPAADEGRVETLFVERDARRWGRYDWVERRVKRQVEPTSAGEDLVDLAAVRTLENGGRVRIADPTSLPDGAPAAAVLRY